MLRSVTVEQPCQGWAEVLEVGGPLFVYGEEAWLGRQQSKLQQMSAVRTSILSSVLE